MMILDNQQYIVMREVESTEHITKMLLRKEDTTDFFNVTKQSREQVKPEEVKFLLDQTKNDAFTDFYDYSTSPEGIYILFHYHHSTSLAQRLLEESLSFQERLDYMKCILERMLLQNMPVYFLHTVAKIEHILVSDSMEISFIYNLEDIAAFESITFSQVCQELCLIFQEVCEKELELHAVEKLETFFYKLDHGEYEDLDQVYQVFKGIYTEYSHEFSIEPQTKPFKIWEKLKQLYGYIMSFFKIFLVLVVIYYLLVSIQMYFDMSEQRMNFSSIGIKVIK